MALTRSINMVKCVKHVADESEESSQAADCFEAPLKALVEHFQFISVRTHFIVPVNQHVVIITDIISFAVYDVRDSLPCIIQLAFRGITRKVKAVLHVIRMSNNSLLVEFVNELLARKWSSRRIETLSSVQGPVSAVHARVHSSCPPQHPCGRASSC